MAKICIFLTIFIVGTRGFGIFNPFEPNTDEGHEEPTKTTNETNIFEKPVIDSFDPFKGLNIFEQIEMEMNRRKDEQRKQLEAWVHGVQSFGMISDGKGPQCSSCVGESPIDCARKATTKQCDTNSECYTIQLSYKEGQTIVQRDCAEKARCESDVCKTIQESRKAVKSCNMVCCKGDMCNKMDVPKPLPTLPGPAALKCLSCQASDDESCIRQAQQQKCPSGSKCATVIVITKEGTKHIARGCTPVKSCKMGLCTSLNRNGIYKSCNASCCNENRCDAFATPPPTVAPVTTEPPKVKCYHCTGNNQSLCDRNISVLECKSGERCYSGEVLIKNAERGTFGRGCIAQTPSECINYCKRFGDSVAYCRFQCCEGNLCNKPGGPITPPPTTLPVTNANRLWCTECHSEVSEEDCESKQTQKQCSSGRVCHFSKAVSPSGVKIFAKGCMEPIQCTTACNRLGSGEGSCKVSCCKENNCNHMITVTTKSPVNNPNIRALLKLIEAFRILLEAIENSIRASAKDFKAANYKDQLTSLMATMGHHERSAAAQSPLEKVAKSQLSALRMRAGAVLKKIEGSS